MADAMNLVRTISLEHEATRVGYNDLINNSLYKKLLTRGTLADRITELRREIERMATNLRDLGSLVSGRNREMSNAMTSLLRWASSLLEVNGEILGYIPRNSADQIEVRLGRCLSSCVDAQSKLILVANLLEGKPADAERVWPIK